MIEIKDGDVVVIRDGDFVEAIYYREFYDDVSSLADQVIDYLNEKKFKEPNLSFMTVIGGNFAVVEQNSKFFNEFSDFARIFNFPTCVCKNCDNLTFVYLDTAKTYCHNCKQFNEDNSSNT